MALPPLATAADLEAALGRTVDATQAEMALRRASARVRHHTRQDITFVAADTVVLDGGGRVLRVPQRPLVVDTDNPLTVTELFGLTATEYPCLEGRDFMRLGSELTRGDPWYAPTRLMGWPWNRPAGVWAPRIRLAYSHGYLDIPEDIVDVVLDLAAMDLSNPENLRSVAIDDYQRTFASETIGSAQLGRGHKEALRSYRQAAYSVRQT